MASPKNGVQLFLPIFLFFSLIFIDIASSLPINRLKLLNIIKEINRKGPYLGLITVFPPEENAFFAAKAFKPFGRYPFVDLSGRRFRVGTVEDKKVIYVRCGVGMINAVATTQQLVDVFNVKGIVHFGIAGNANDSMSIGDVTIPKQFAHTGIWDWLNPDEKLPSNDVASLNIGKYHVPKQNGTNLLGHIGYSSEQLFLESGKANTPTPLFWAQTSRQWLQVATTLEGMKLENCVNSSLCLARKPKLVVGLKGSSASIFVDNAAYRTFLYQTFGVSSVDMESAAVVITSLSNGYPVIVIRGLSDLAGGQKGKNAIQIFGYLAALNAAKSVIQFVSKLPKY